MTQTTSGALGCIHITSINFTREQTNENIQQNTETIRGNAPRQNKYQARQAARRAFPRLDSAFGAYDHRSVGEHTPAPNAEAIAAKVQKKKKRRMRECLHGAQDVELAKGANVPGLWSKDEKNRRKAEAISESEET